MKNISMMLVIFLMSISNIYAQDWIPYRENNVIVNTQPIYYVQQPLIVYQWISIVVQQNTVVEQHCLFRKVQTIINQPVIQWVYQPVLIYR